MYMCNCQIMREYGQLSILINRYPVSFTLKNVLPIHLSAHSKTGTAPGVWETLVNETNQKVPKSPLSLHFRGGREKAKDKESSVYRVPAGDTHQQGSGGGWGTRAWRQLSKWSGGCMRRWRLSTELPEGRGQAMQAWAKRARAKGLEGKATWPQ